MTFNKSFLYPLSFFLILVLFSASNLVVSVESYKYFSLIRLFSFFTLLAVFIFIVFSRFKVDYSLLFFLYFSASFSFFYIFDNDIDFFKNFRDIFLVSLSSVLTVLLFKSYDKDKEICIFNFIVLYYFFAIAILYFSDSFVFDFPPRFNFSFGSDLIGREETYSLGVSNFFGLNAIIFAYGFVMRYPRRWLMLLLSVSALIMSALGGARGEFLIAIFLFLMIIFFLRFNYIRFVVLSVLFIVTVFFASRFLNFEEIMLSIELFNRFGALQSGDFSSRDTLISQSLQLLANEPKCLFFGCGPDFFQSYYNYSIDLYPHNSVLEYFISYGALSFFVFFALTIYGVVRFVSERRFLTLPVIIFSYCFLVSLKSGYLLGSWLLMTLVFSFSAFALSLLTSKGYYEKRSV